MVTRILSHCAHQRETAAWCTEVGDLPLIKPRSDQLYLPLIRIATHIGFQHMRHIVRADRAFTWHSKLLRNITTLHDFAEHTPRQIRSTVRTLAAVATHGFEKPLFAL